MTRTHFNKRRKTVVGLFIATAVLVLTSPSPAASSDSSNQPDEACVAPLETLLDCLPYAQGKQAVPTSTCCGNVKKIFQSQKKCLCELMAASFQDTQGGASAGLPPFNSTLALHMPAACNVPADPSLCPGLLGLSPSSPIAKEFTNTGSKSNGTTLASPSDSKNSTSSSDTNISTGSNMNMKTSSSLSKTTFVTSYILMGMLVSIYSLMQM